MRLGVRIWVGCEVEKGGGGGLKGRSKGGKREMEGRDISEYV